MTFLTELRELEEKATDGPWKLIKHSDGQHIWGEVWATENGEEYQIVHEQFNSYNAELIACLRNHAKEIIKLVEAAEGKKEWVGLTDEEILDIVGRAGAGYPAVVPPYTRGLFKKIEDKLREKNA